MAKVITFTEVEVDKFVRDTMNAAITGFQEWLKEETDIVDKDTKEVLENTEIALKPNPKLLLKTYIYPKLREKGINFTENENEPI